jgi:uncharacterized damage-inducible protein DinB
MVESIDDVRPPQVYLKDDAAPILSGGLLMSLATRLANHLERTVTGPMWHGPALAPVLEGVTHDGAAARPIPNAHSIWEIVLHVAVWAEIARARLKGERTADPPPEEDWPPITATTADDWRLAIERLGYSYRMLAADTREMDDATLASKVADLGYSVSVMLHGVVEHGTYHGGQIMMLRKALG